MFHVSSCKKTLGESQNIIICIKFRHLHLTAREPHNCIRMWEDKGYRALYAAKNFIRGIFLDLKVVVQKCIYEIVFC